jgi:hypothetical protein
MEIVPTKCLLRLCVQLTCTLNDVLSGELPMTPPKGANVVQDTQVQDHGAKIAGVGEEIADTNISSLFADGSEEFAMRLRSVLSELAQDLSKWVLRHGDLAKVVQKRDNAIIRTRLATEELRLVIILALVNDTVREHRLVSDTVDESAVGHVIFGQRVGPHFFHVGFDDGHGLENGLKTDFGVGDGVLILLLGASGRDGFDDVGGAFDQLAGLGNHMDMGEDEACFGRLWVKTFLESADEAEVGVVVVALGRVDEVVVVQSIGSGV